MATTGDLIRISTYGTLQGQDVINVWFYNINIDDTGGVNLSDLAIQWGVAFDTQILSLLCTALQYQRIVIENLTDGFEFSEGTFSATGDNAGESMPVHDTLSVKMLRSTKLTRNGRKSFSGVPESGVNGGLITFSELHIQQIEDFVGGTFVYLDPDDNSLEAYLQPVIVGRTKDANGIYQLDLGKLNPVTGATVNPKVRTQNTRK